MVIRCEECDAPIPEERLEALPNTIHCVQCSVERPLTERDLDLDGPSKDDLRDNTAQQDTNVASVRRVR